MVIRIVGELPSLEGHVIDGSRITPEMSHEERHDRAVAIQRYEPQPGMIVGFVSDAHEGVFTHRGESVHAHAILWDEGITVHIDGMTIPPGTVVEVGLAADSM